METIRYWIFSHHIDGFPVFERSTPELWRAKQRVEELKSWYNWTEAFYTTELPKKFWS